MNFHAMRVVWGRLAIRLFALLASYASILGVIIPALDKYDEVPTWMVATLIGSAMLFISFVALEIASCRLPRKVYSKRDQDSIKNYMHDWIKHGRRVAIWSRDMSWANQPEILELLKQKAKGGNLILCLPKLNACAKSLTEIGAETVIYGNAKVLKDPASRFTIINYGTVGSRVAVGRSEGNSHVIDEFSAGNHPAFHLADDLVSLARQLASKS